MSVSLYACECVLERRRKRYGDDDDKQQQEELSGWFQSYVSIMVCSIVQHLGALNYLPEPRDVYPETGQISSLRFRAAKNIEIARASSKGSEEVSGAVS